MVITMHIHTTLAFAFFMNCYLFDGNLDMKMDDSLVCLCKYDKRHICIVTDADLEEEGIDSYASFNGF
jgi:hypothetical protein